MSYFGQAEAPNVAQRSSEGTSYPIVRTYRDEAACKGADPEIFYPTRGEDLSTALAYCAICPVVEECLIAGWIEGDIYSVRGGMSARQRFRWAKGRRRALRCEVCRIDFLGIRGQATCSKECSLENAARRNRKSSADHRRNGA